MIPPGPPLSAPLAPEMIDAPAALGVEAPPATDAVTKVSFFDEQRRRRRQTWRLSLVCLLIALALGIAGGMLKGAALFGCAEICPKSAHAIGLFARQEMKLLIVIVEQGSRAHT